MHKSSGKPARLPRQSFPSILLDSTKSDRQNELPRLIQLAQQKLLDFVRNMMPDPPLLTPSIGGMSIDASALTAGDVIVTTSRGIVAAAIEAVTSGPVSHVMVSVGDSQIVEAIREGVREISLVDALDDATLAVAFRRTSITSDAINTAVANLRSAVAIRIITGV